MQKIASKRLFMRSSFQAFPSQRAVSTRAYSRWCRVFTLRIFSGFCVVTCRADKSQSKSQRSTSAQRVRFYQKQNRALPPMTKHCSTLFQWTTRLLAADLDLLHRLRLRIFTCTSWGQACGCLTSIIVSRWREDDPKPWQTA